MKVASLATLLLDAGITADVEVFKHESRDNGISTWSTVELCGPKGIRGQSQVAHCCDHEDAVLIATLINLALRQEFPGLGDRNDIMPALLELVSSFAATTLKDPLERERFLEHMELLASFTKTK